MIEKNEKEICDVEELMYYWDTIIYTIQATHYWLYSKMILVEAEEVLQTESKSKSQIWC